MHWLPHLPRKGTLLPLFQSAKLRLSLLTADAGMLSKARIESATGELNQIADDIRDAQELRLLTSAVVKELRPPERLSDSGVELDRG